MASEFLKWEIIDKGEHAVVKIDLHAYLVAQDAACIAHALLLLNDTLSHKEKDND